MKKFSKTLAKFANGWFILALFAVESAFMGFILPGMQKKIEAGGGQVLDLMFFPSPETTSSILAGFNPEALSLYRNVELSVDVLYPITYTLFYSLFITFLLNRALDKENPLQMLNLLPFGSLTFDLLENVSIVSLLTVQPAQRGAFAIFLMLANGAKWMFAGASILALIFAIIALLIRKLQKVPAVKVSSS